MLPSFRLTTLLSLLLSLTLHLATAQTGWQQLYGHQHHEQSFASLQQADGGYLLVGSQDFTAPAGLYLLRTNARGRQQWERRIATPTLAPMSYRLAAQDENDQILLVGQAQQSGPYYLVQLTAAGLVRWTRRFNAGDRLTGVVARPGGGFVVARSSGSSAFLLYLAADGTQLREDQFRPTGYEWNTIEKLFAVPGGIVVSARTQMYDPPYTRVSRLSFVSDQGVRGPETTLPNGGYISGLVALGGNEYVASGAETYGITLGSNQPRWRTLLPTRGGSFTPVSGVLSPRGEVLLYGTLYNTHSGGLALVLLDPMAGTVLGSTTLYTGLGAYLAAGTHLDAATGDFVVAGTRRAEAGQPEGDMFLLGGRFGDLIIGSPPPLQACPNPIGDDGMLRVTSPDVVGGGLRLYDLQGHCVRTWPPVAGSEASVSLQGLPPGVYLLAGTDGQGRRRQQRILKQ